ncbi:AmmeMemoRadiSam system protein A [Desulfosalsimonas propionicica]|uniref:AmmeMemoRadiSam system protein A n=1 Tax=Desulfosalsimonas propionicica TaxID=332175 RepID=A0A7W0C775_9BACT|nr:AmmeMemoRadiSam system protein A [Desulfosalsimonas propionicica]MBA2880451.1 AmmeMemoRadiSam system protein A [Desulfosalsimonas propionicica]
MTEEHQSREFDEKKGEILLEIARKTIAERLGLSYKPSTDLDAASRDTAFESRRGTFVTLKINDQLRGCIGNLLPDKPLISAVQDNAVNAAFQDPRFAPLSKQEFEKIQIEVSLLTEPKPLNYKDGRDLLDKLRPHVDGVILRKGPYSSTFLPQVWEQLPDQRTFLEQLCMKAGLPSDAWQKGDTEVLTYQVEYFEEPR